MDIGLREWLMVIGIVVIAGILFDGWRRMSSNKGKLKFQALINSVRLIYRTIEEDPNLLGPARVQGSFMRDPGTRRSMICPRNECHRGPDSIFSAPSHNRAI